MGIIQNHKNKKDMSEANNKPQEAEVNPTAQEGQEKQNTEATADKTEGDGKKKGAAQKPKAESSSALKSVGLAACKRHGLKQVWVASDGQAFAQESDAKAHAANLQSKDIIKITAK